MAEHTPDVAIVVYNDHANGDRPRLRADLRDRHGRALPGRRRGVRPPAGARRRRRPGPLAATSSRADRRGLRPDRLPGARRRPRADRAAVGVLPRPRATPGRARSCPCWSTSSSTRSRPPRGATPWAGRSGGAIRSYRRRRDRRGSSAPAACPTSSRARGPGSSTPSSTACSSRPSRPTPRSWPRSRREELIRQAGSEGIELIMWLVMRGAMSEQITKVHSTYSCRPPTPPPAGAVRQPGGQADRSAGPRGTAARLPVAQCRRQSNGFERTVGIAQAGQQ